IPLHQSRPCLIPDERVTATPVKRDASTRMEMSAYVKDAEGFWDEIGSSSPRAGKVVEAFKKYAVTMEKAGYPYR
ncbi:hypothetical protein, partial [Sphingomonas psychrolutea]|uniref:hypothetical protein n=1 Tax=Sphingomonas psychrolutea TaxID=1259676 RepID=UPI0025498755